MTAQSFLQNLGLESIQDDIVKHPKSGSDYSLLYLLEKFELAIRKEHGLHDSDCSMHNEPEKENEPCDCSITN